MPSDIFSLREGKNRRSLRLKIELLESAVQTGVTTEAMLRLRTAADVAAWVDPGLGLSSWSSPNVTSKEGHYPDLAMRLRQALSALSRFSSEPVRSGSSKVESERAKQRTSTAQKAELLALAC